MNIAQIAKEHGINPKSLWRRVKVQGMTVEEALAKPWRGNKTCAIDGCEGKHEARGLCQNHYNQWYLHGDANKRIRAKRGSGWIGIGYKFIGERQEHILIAEQAIGKKLPDGAVVHHVNQNRSDNRPENLVICNSQAYHLLIHKRLNAYTASGNPSWRKCTYCKQYDDPINMYVTDALAFHRKCRQAKAAERKGAQKS